MALLERMKPHTQSLSAANVKMPSRQQVPPHLVPWSKEFEPPNGYKPIDYTDKSVYEQWNEKQVDGWADRGP